jgi:glycosyltransferase involved in cell wall biosynthesis
MKKTRVAIIGTTGLPARYGGFETLAENLVNKLSNQFDFTVYCSTRYYWDPANRPREYKGAKLHYLPLNANGYQSIPYDILSVLHAVGKNDVLLLLGVSGALMLPFIRMFTKKPVLVNIDGLEWKRPKWNFLAKKVLVLSEWMSVSFADELITDNKVIYDYVAHDYERKDHRLITYGGDHVRKLPLTNDLIREYPFLASPYAFHVSRIEPENNIHLILQAFSRSPQHQLVMVGLWSHGKYGQEMKSRFSRFENIHLLDPIYDQEKLNRIRTNASLYVHGHSAGGTNPGLVEAMTLGLPVFCYDVSYNRETTFNKAAYFQTAQDLMALLDEQSNMNLKAMAQELEVLARTHYTWDQIAMQYAAAFRREKIENALLHQAVKQQEVKEIQLREAAWKEEN